MNDIKNQQAEVVSVQAWVIALVVMFIPIVNVVMMLVWAFGYNTPRKLDQKIAANKIE